MKIKATAYDADGSLVKCSTCGSEDTAGAFIGIDSQWVYCLEHSPFKNAPEARIVYDSSRSAELNKEFPPVIEDWTFDWREQKK